MILFEDVHEEGASKLRWEGFFPLSMPAIFDPIDNPGTGDLDRPRFSEGGVAVRELGKKEIKEMGREGVREGGEKEGEKGGRKGGREDGRDGEKRGGGYREERSATERFF